MAAPPPTTKISSRLATRHRILQNAAFPAKSPPASASVTRRRLAESASRLSDYNDDELKVAGLIIENEAGAVTTVSATA